jgi:DNA-binding transcriptional ArsR family regulator
MDESQALAALAALGQPVRLAVFRALVRAGDHGMIASEVAAAVGARQNTLSVHLAVLGRAGLVRSAREGRAVRFRADLEGLRALLGFLMEDCCGGRPEVCRPVLDALVCGG